jgi:hypothetical protein
VLHPFILTLGLLACALPIIIHLLLRRKRPPMDWGAMRFVIEAQRKTRRRQLEKWLLLAARVLLLALLGVALARPIIGRTQAVSAGSRTLWLVIDDSLATGALAPGASSAQSNLAASLAHAQTALRSLGAADRCAVVLASAPARPLVVPPTADLPAVAAALARIEPQPVAPDWPGALDAVARALVDARAAAPGQSHDVLLVSPWRAGALPASALSTQFASAGEPDVRLRATPPATEPLASVGIERVTPARPVQLTGAATSDQVLSVELLRTGDAARAGPATTTLTARWSGAGDAELGRATVTWAPGQRQAVATLALIDAAGAQQAEGAAAVVVSAQTAGDALRADDAHAVPLIRRDTLRVALLEEASSTPSAGARLRPGQWLRLALRPSEAAPLDLQTISAAEIDAARLAALDALWVLSPDALTPARWQRLATWVQSGGLLIVSPPAGATLHDWASTMLAPDALGMNWSLPQTATTFAPDALARIGPSQAPVAQGAPANPLAQIAGELEELARPVGVFKLLPPALQPPVGAEPRQTHRVVLTTQQGQPVLTALAPLSPGTGARAPRGMVLYLSLAPEVAWTDLVAKPLFVPLVQELVRQGVGNARPGLSIVAGRASLRTLLPGAARLISLQGNEVLTLGAAAPSAPARTGVYRAADDAGQDQGLVAINPDTRAGALESSATGAVAQAFAGVTTVAGAPSPALAFVGDDDAGQASATGQASGPTTPIGAGPLLLAGVLALALVELLLARRASRVGYESAGAARA